MVLRKTTVRKTIWEKDGDRVIDRQTNNEVETKIKWRHGWNKWAAQSHAWVWIQRHDTQSNIVHVWKDNAPYVC